MYCADLLVSTIVELEQNVPGGERKYGGVVLKKRWGHDRRIALVINQGILKTFGGILKVCYILYI